MTLSISIMFLVANTTTSQKILISYPSSNNWRRNITKKNKSREGKKIRWKGKAQSAQFKMWRISASTLKIRIISATLKTMCYATNAISQDILRLFVHRLSHVSIVFQKSTSRRVVLKKRYAIVVMGLDIW